jgi:3D (Asp-Asp-Asp) domain-containing protein
MSKIETAILGLALGFALGVLLCTCPHASAVARSKVVHHVRYTRVEHTYGIATAYCDRGTTASGLLVGPRIVAVDPTHIRLGTKIWLNHHPYVAGDTGGVIRWRGGRGTADFDLWMASCTKADDWGRRVVAYDRFRAVY